MWEGSQEKLTPWSVESKVWRSWRKEGVFGMWTAVIQWRATYNLPDDVRRCGDVGESWHPENGFFWAERAFQDETAGRRSLRTCRNLALDSLVFGDLRLLTTELCGGKIWIQSCTLRMLIHSLYHNKVKGRKLYRTGLNKSNDA